MLNHILTMIMVICAVAAIVLVMGAFVAFSVTLNSPVPTVTGALLVTGTAAGILINWDPFDKK